jgi:AAA+ superfamily predicted ATPase
MASLARCERLEVVSYEFKGQNLDNMLPNEESVLALREAVELAPKSVPLRLHLAEVLLALERLNEAEREYRAALALAPNHEGVKIGLAETFYRQDKHSQALVLVEDLLKGKATPARAYLLHARLMAQSGDMERAVRAYREAVDLDASIADPAFAQMLGIDAPVGSEVVEGRVRLGHASTTQPHEEIVEHPTINFADVGGMDALKEDIRLKIIYPLTHPELYQAYGKGVGGGILLYGPPGCGKTYLARATAGEVNANFLAIGIDDVLDMWVGQSERNLHGLFEKARANRPCVLFFDEVDALGASRADLRYGGARQLINQFLAELDGVKHSNEGVLILAATNAPWHLDNAFRRPGRFDRILFVPPPDAPARADILRILCRGKPAEKVDYDHAAKKTPDFSGADLKAVLDAAVEKKLQEAIRSRGSPPSLTTRDLLAAASAIRPSTQEWFATARNYALYSNQGGLYDDIRKYLKL